MRYAMMAAFCGYAASMASASLMDGQMTSLDTSSTTWKASSLTANGDFYASGYALSNGSAMLSTSQADKGCSSMESARRSIVVAVPVTKAGSYSWSLSTALTDYDKQYNYFQAYAVKEGATIALTGGPGWGAAPTGTTLLAKDYAPNGKDDGKYYSYTLKFSLTDKQIQQGYQYVALVMTGSRQASQSMGWQGITTTMAVPMAAASVPEPATVGLLLLGGLWAIYRPDRAKV